jgi:hypothetical protein
MPLVTPDLGEIELFNKMLKNALVVDETYTLRLYRNDVTPTKDTVAADFTATTFTGYSEQILTRANWSDAVTNPDDKAESAYPQLSWTCGTTGDTIYGYWVIGSSSGVCLWAERFNSPRILAQSDIFKLTPKFTLDSEF